MTPPKPNEEPATEPAPKKVWLTDSMSTKKLNLTDSTPKEAIEFLADVLVLKRLISKELE